MSKELRDLTIFQAVERGDKDCPICLTDLVSNSYIQNPNSSEDKKYKDNKTGKDQAKNSNLPKSRKSKQSCSETEYAKEMAKDGEWPLSRNQTEVKRTLLLSCSHVFHETCLEMFEELCLENSNSCPVCRTKYHKRVLNT